VKNQPKHVQKSKICGSSSPVQFPFEIIGFAERSDMIFQQVILIQSYVLPIGNLQPKGKEIYEQ